MLPHRRGQPPPQARDPPQQSPMPNSRPLSGLQSGNHKPGDEAEKLKSYNLQPSPTTHPFGSRGPWRSSSRAGSTYGKMYEDSWYNYIPEFQQQQQQQQPAPQHKRGPSQSYGHRRRESLLQQPNVSLYLRLYKYKYSGQNLLLTACRAPMLRTKQSKTSRSC